LKSRLNCVVGDAVDDENDEAANETSTDNPNPFMMTKTDVRKLLFPRWTECGKDASAIDDVAFKSLMEEEKVAKVGLADI
jgi:hypothetical protein